MHHKKSHTMDFLELPSSPESTPQPPAPNVANPVNMSEEPVTTAPIPSTPNDTKPASQRLQIQETTGSSSPSLQKQEGHYLPSGDALWAGGGGLIPGRIDLQDPMMGQLVADRYLILSKLGEGGVGKVYCAEQKPLQRMVALKFLHPHSATLEETKIRFQREALSMTRLSHPGLVTVYDFGEWQGQFFLAMEILQGVSMYKWLYQHFPFPTPLIVEVMSQIAQALGAAHTAGLIHRDLKPENVMISEDHPGQIHTKIVDWGLVLLQEGAKTQRLTLEGVTVGTPHYMSPEQCQGQTVDQRSDLYALGTMLYEMLTGNTPFSGENPMGLMIQQIVAQPQPPSLRNPHVDISPVLEELALRCLAKSPADRPQTAQDFLDHLQRAIHTNNTLPTSSRQGTSLDRDARADALGIPKLSESVLYAPTAFAEYTFLVIEETQHYQDSLTMQMWAHGFTVKHSPNLKQASQDITRLHPTGLVIRLQPDPHTDLEQVLTWIQQTPQAKDLSVVILGPDDSFALMNRTLEQGLFDYIPVGQIASKLAKSIRRLIRHSQRKAGRT